MGVIQSLQEFHAGDPSALPFPVPSEVRIRYLTISGHVAILWYATGDAAARDVPLRGNNRGRWTYELSCDMTSHNGNQHRMMLRK
jgi:hypothetical protein